MSGRRQDWPRFSRAEIRHFAEWLDSEGWTYEGVDANGHTIWSHPQAMARYKLSGTPRHFSVKLARADVYRLLGRKVDGKRKKKVKPKRQRQDFALQSVRRQTQARTAAPSKDGTPAPVPAILLPRQHVPKRLPWEDQPDDYDRGIAQMMRQVPGGRKR